MSTTNEIVNFFQNEAKDVKTLLCMGCGFIKVYDKMNVPYTIRFSTASLDVVKSLVESIRTNNVEELKMFRAKTNQAPSGRRVSPVINKTFTRRFPPIRE